MLEQLHKTVEQFIDSNMSGSGLKYSLNVQEPRDYSLPEAPLLFEGTEDFVIFDVKISESRAVAIGNKGRRRIGQVNFEVHTDRKNSQRAGYRLIDVITSFLERTNYEGVLFKDALGTGDFEIGNWRVNTWTVNFIKTNTNL